MVFFPEQTRIDRGLLRTTCGSSYTLGATMPEMQPSHSVSQSSAETSAQCSKDEENQEDGLDDLVHELGLSSFAEVTWDPPAAQTLCKNRVIRASYHGERFCA